MRSADWYRFTIQFKRLSAEREAVGEYLEALKNKKSECIVRAVGAYISSDTDRAKATPDIKEAKQDSKEDTTLDNMLDCLDQW